MPAVPGPRVLGRVDRGGGLRLTPALGLVIGIAGLGLDIGDGIGGCGGEPTRAVPTRRGELLPHLRCGLGARAPENVVEIGVRAAEILPVGDVKE